MHCCSWIQVASAPSISTRETCAWIVPTRHPPCRQDAPPPPPAAGSAAPASLPPSSPHGCCWRRRRRHPGAAAQLCRRPRQRCACTAGGLGLLAGAAPHPGHLWAVHQRQTAGHHPETVTRGPNTAGSGSGAAQEPAVVSPLGTGKGRQCRREPLCTHQHPQDPATGILLTAGACSKEPTCWRASVCRRAGWVGWEGWQQVAAAAAAASSKGAVGSPDRQQPHPAGLWPRIGPSPLQLQQFA